MEQEKKKPRHSTTIYLPRKHNSFLVRAIRARSKDLFGASDGTGKNSKYIMQLVMKDLKTNGLFKDNGDPNEDALVDLEKRVKEDSERANF